MKALLQSALFVVLIGAGAYLAFPGPKFPDPPPGSLQSQEPADTESVYRKAYFTNQTREQLMAYYQGKFYFPGQFRLNYPPEEAFNLIRDQTRSHFLEEIVHPGRESLFVNGFVPILPTDQINRNGVHYLNKITVRLIPSHPVTRLTVLGLIALGGYLIIKYQLWPNT
jgi:hypothetical protein